MGKDNLQRLLTKVCQPNVSFNLQYTLSFFFTVLHIIQHQMFAFDVVLKFTCMRCYIYWN